MVDVLLDIGDFSNLEETAEVTLDAMLSLTSFSNWSFLSSSAKYPIFKTSVEFNLDLKTAIS